jgi:hypothetical protein
VTLICCILRYLPILRLCNKGGIVNSHYEDGYNAFQAGEEPYMKSQYALEEFNEWLDGWLSAWRDFDPDFNEEYK